MAAAEAAISTMRHRHAPRGHGRARLLALLLALWSADALLLAGCPSVVVPEHADRGGDGGSGNGGGGGM